MRRKTSCTTSAGSTRATLWSSSIRFVVFALLFDVDVIKHVFTILSNLDISVFRIYSGMQQKQRIKHLNNFKKEQNAVLLATDVAARGLDIPNVNTVINYHLPPTPVIFVHRCGRTARGGTKGLALAMVSPQEKKLYHEILQYCGAGNGFASFPLGVSISPLVSQCVSLAREISKVVSEGTKVDRDALWLKRSAEEAELEVEEEEEGTKLSNRDKKRIRVAEECR